MHCVILEHVLDKTPDAGRSLIAQIHGEAQRHSGGGRPLTGATHAVAVAALRELPGGRPDLPTAADFLVSAAQTSGAGGARTHDRRIMRTTAPCTTRASCTDGTGYRTDVTRRAGINSSSGP